jgi:hypothetical protein
MRARFDTSSIRPEIDGDMIDIARHKPADETPEFAGQNIGLAIPRADDVARL